MEGADWFKGLLTENVARMSAEEHGQELESLVTSLTTALVVIPESGLAQEDVPMTTMFVAMRLTGIGNQTTAAKI